MTHKDRDSSITKGVSSVMLDLWATLSHWFTHDGLARPVEAWPGGSVPGMAPDQITGLWMRSDILDPSALAHILWLGLLAGQAGWTVEACDAWHAATIACLTPSSSRHRLDLFHEVWRSGLAQFDWLHTDAQYPQSVLGFLAAIAQGQLQAYYQPVIAIQTGQIHSAEALVRWQDGDQLRLPGQFLPLAQSAGLLGLVDMVVWAQVLREMPELRRRQHALSVSINAGQTPLQQASWPAFLAQWRQQHGLAADTISIEVLENLLITQNVRSTMTVLAEHGFAIALDDFGTRTAIDLLGDAAVHTMKIDRSLIVAGTRNSRVGIIVRGLVAMAHQLMLEVVAEGVETVDQLEACRDWGIDYIQGFLLGRPMPYAAFLQVLEQGPCVMPARESAS